MTFLLTNLEPQKATVQDGIPIKFLNGNRLTLLSQVSLNQSTFPYDCKRAFIVPVYKKGITNSLPEDYRRISLTCVVCKILERIISINNQSRLTKHNYSNRPVTWFQK